MQEVRDRVRLVEASEIGAREIETTVPRAEIEDVLRSKDGDPELVLDLTREGEAEARTLRLAWDPGELEDLLRKADGDDVTLRFDGSELERALAADVEAHGMREAALVVAVAATTAAAGAGIGQARIGPVAQGSGATPAAATSHATTGGVVSEREWPQTVNTSTVSEREWPQLVPGAAEQRAVPAAAQQSGIVSEREWPQVVNTSPAPSSGAVSEREWPQLVPAAGAQPQAVSASDSSGGSDAATAGVVAGAAVLLISAAGFAVRKRGEAEPRPA
jgi:hypothetical protein